MSIKTISVECPSCQKPVLMTDEYPHRPFCSERCKSLDFADWATENRSIPGENVISGENEQDIWSEDFDKSL